MSRSITPLAFGLCLVTGLALAHTVSAGPKKLPAIGSAVGQVTSFDPGTGKQTIVAMGKGSILGPHTSHITAFIDFQTGKVSGSFDSVADHGSTSVVGTYSGHFQPIDGTPSIRFILILKFEAGTGRLKGVSGKARVDAVQNLATGKVAYRYQGRFEFDH